MRNGTAGPLGAVVLFSGVLAVPLLAVFGVPQFAPVSASPGDSVGHDLGLSRHDFEEAAEEFPAFSSPPTSPRENAGDDAGWSDPFGPQEIPAPPFENAAVQPPAWSPPRDTVGEWQSEQSAAPQRANANAGGTIPANFGASPSPPRRDLTVEAAAPRNNPPQRAEPNQSARQLERDFAWAADGRSTDSPTPPSSTDRLSGFGDKADSTADRRSPATSSAPPTDAVRPGSETPRNSFPPVGVFGRPQDQPARTIQESPTDRTAGGRQPNEDVGNAALDQAPLTWRSAVARLNALGIQHFQLEPGETGGFLFSCSYSPGNNPRITRRFEAEAAEPLRAVERVLAQVEQWLHQQ